MTSTTSLVWEKLIGTVYGFHDFYDFHGWRDVLGRLTQGGF